MLHGSGLGLTMGIRVGRLQGRRNGKQSKGQAGMSRYAPIAACL